MPACPEKKYNALPLLYTIICVRRERDLRYGYAARMNQHYKTARCNERI